MSPPFPESPRAVTFDCWQTLIVESSWETAHGLRVAALERAARAAGGSPSTAEAGRAFDAAWARHMDLWARQVATGARDVAHWALEELGIAPEGDHFAPLLEAFEEASHSGRVELAEDAKRELERLR